MPDNWSETCSKGNQSNDIAEFLVSNTYLSVIQNCRQLYRISTGGSGGKESACNAEDLGSILGLGRSPGGGHGNPLQYSCLENLQGQRSLAGYNPWGCKESDTRAQWEPHCLSGKAKRGTPKVYQSGLRLLRGIGDLKGQISVPVCIRYQNKATTATATGP